MSRIRTIKPELAKHEGLYDLELELNIPLRFAWAMLPTACDREGRFAWRPRTLKADILPHDLIEFSRVLDAWLTRGYILKYRVGKDWFGWVPTFRKHQVVNARESASSLPSIDQADEVVDYRNQQDANASATGVARVNDASATGEVHARGERKGKEGKGKEEKKEQPQAAFAQFERPNWIGSDAWDGYAEMRKRKRAPLTPRACTMVVKELSRLRALGQDPDAVLDQSTRNSWTDVYALKNPDGGNGASIPGGGPAPSATDLGYLHSVAK